MTQTELQLDKRDGFLVLVGSLAKVLNKAEFVEKRTAVLNAAFEKVEMGILNRSFEWKRTLGGIAGNQPHECKGNFRSQVVLKNADGDDVLIPVFLLDRRSYGMPSLILISLGEGEAPCCSYYKDAGTSDRPRELERRIYRAWEEMQGI